MAGGWKDSDRRDRLPSNWGALVAETRRRAKGRCQWTLPSGKRCPRDGTDCDHKVPGDDHRQSNLAWLCSEHHLRKSSKEGNAAKYGRKKIPLRTEGRHPGEIG